MFLLIRKSGHGIINKSCFIYRPNFITLQFNVGSCVNDFSYPLNNVGRHVSLSGPFIYCLVFWGFRVEG